MSLFVLEGIKREKRKCPVRRGGKEKLKGHLLFFPIHILLLTIVNILFPKSCQNQTKKTTFVVFE